RHVFGTPNKKEQCYDNLKISRSAWDTNLVKANPLFLSVNLEIGGGGAFAVIPLGHTGRIDPPAFTGHTSAVLDTDFNPFNDHIVASCAEDCRVMVWRIPEGGPKQNIETPALTLNGHGRKVGHVLFHPSAENVLLSASGDFTVKIWDVSQGAQQQELVGHTELIQGITWSYDGALAVTTCKDKRIRVFDVRSNTIVHEAPGHQGVKGTRVEWMGALDKFVTTGFSRSSERQVYFWDLKKMSEPLRQENIDTASGLIVPKFDADTSVLYLAGKGDGNIRYYEWTDDDRGFFPLSEYKSSDPLRGIGFLPKRACAINECEVARIFKVHPTFIEPISFKVPRKSDAFQADIFPDTVGPEAALTADEYFGGKTLPPKLISLENGFVPAAAAKEFVTSAPAPTDIGAAAVRGPQTEKEYQDAYHSLRKENDDLKNQVSQRDAKIRQLESQIEGLLRRA
ncbi:Coronin-2B, partial [Cladochytrium tenue]